MIAFKFAKAKPAKKRELGGAAGLFDGGLDAEQPLERPRRLAQRPRSLKLVSSCS